MRVRATCTALCAAAALVAAAAPASAATVEQMVVFKNGTTEVGSPSAAGTRTRVGRRSCAIAGNTALAALIRSEVATVGLRDYGNCGRSARDAGGLYVYKIGRDRERGRGGWVYKVGSKLATAGAGDSSGPFGRGRLRAGTRVTWFYCLLEDDGSCQRTLGTRSRLEPGGVVAVTVRSYDDEGRARLAPGATVHGGGTSATAGADGVARLTLPQGMHDLHAEQAGLIRSFPEAVEVP